MVSTNLDKTLSIAWSLALANVIGTMACLALSKQVSKLALIPAKILTPFLLVIMTVAAFQSTRNWGDLIAFLVIGIIGWFMKQVGFPRPPMLIGFVLAISAERYLHRSMSLYGTEWFGRPIVITVFVVIMLILFGASIRDFRKRVSRRSKKATTGEVAA
jgi:TctA family transporter